MYNVLIVDDEKIERERESDFFFPEKKGTFIF